MGKEMGKKMGKYELFYSIYTDLIRFTIITYGFIVIGK